MKLNKRLILTACVAALAAATAFADYTPTSPEIVSSRLNAMGGSNPALTRRGIDTLSTNPAAFAFEEKDLRVIGIDAVLSGPFSDVVNIINAGDDITNAVTNMVRNNNGVYFGANMTGPISVAYTAKNFGFGIFNRTYLSADVASITSGNISAGEEILVTAGFGIKVLDIKQHELAIGIQGKLFLQAGGSLSGTLTSLVQTATSLSLDSLPVNSAIGAGFDLGLLYRFAESLSVGVVCKDVCTPVFYGEHASIDGLLNMVRSSSGRTFLDRDLQVGIAWQPRIPRSWHTITDFTLAAGMSDLLNVANITARNPILNVSLGVEAVFFNILALRAGINETYPALGLGIDLKVFQLDMALYGSELGYEPGERPLYNMSLGLAFGF